MSAPKIFTNFFVIFVITLAFISIVHQSAYAQSSDSSVRFTKGIVWSSDPRAIYGESNTASTNGLVYSSSDSAWSAYLSKLRKSSFAGNKLSSSVSDIEAGTELRMALIIENLSKSPLYQLRVQDNFPESVERIQDDHFDISFGNGDTTSGRHNGSAVDDLDFEFVGLEGQNTAGDNIIIISYTLHLLPVTRLDQRFSVPTAKISFNVDSTSQSNSANAAVQMRIPRIFLRQLSDEEDPTADQKDDFFLETIILFPRGAYNGSYRLEIPSAGKAQITDSYVEDVGNDLTLNSPIATKAVDTNLDGVNDSLSYTVNIVQTVPTPDDFEVSPLNLLPSAQVKLLTRFVLLDPSFDSVTVQSLLIPHDKPENEPQSKSAFTLTEKKSSLITNLELISTSADNIARYELTVSHETGSAQTAHHVQLLLPLTTSTCELISSSVSVIQGQGTISNGNQSIIINFATLPIGQNLKVNFQEKVKTVLPVGTVLDPGVKLNYQSHASPSSVNIDSDLRLSSAPDQISHLENVTSQVAPSPLHTGEPAKLTITVPIPKGSLPDLTLVVGLPTVPPYFMQIKDVNVQSGSELSLSLKPKIVPIDSDNDGKQDAIKVDVGPVTNQLSAPRSDLKDKIQVVASFVVDNDFESTIPLNTTSFIITTNLSSSSKDYSDSLTDSIIVQVIEPRLIYQFHCSIPDPDAPSTALQDCTLTISHDSTSSASAYGLQYNLVLPAGNTINDLVCEGCKETGSGISFSSAQNQEFSNNSTKKVTFGMKINSASRLLQSTLGATDHSANVQIKWASLPTQYAQIYSLSSSNNLSRSGQPPLTKDDFAKICITQSNASDILSTYVDILANDANEDVDLTSLKIQQQPQFCTARIVPHRNFDDPSSRRPVIQIISPSRKNPRDTLVYSICDYRQQCSSSTVFIQVSSANEFTAVDDRIVLGEHTQRAIQVLDNDVPSCDSTIDPLSVSLVTQPKSGSAKVQQDGSILFSAERSSVGQDGFTYRVCDSKKLCGQASVTIVISSLCKNSFTHSSSIAYIAYHSTSDNNIPQASLGYLNLLTGDSSPFGPSYPYTRITALAVNPVTGDLLTYIVSAGNPASPAKTGASCGWRRVDKRSGILQPEETYKPLTNNCSKLVVDAAFTAKGQLWGLDDSGNYFNYHQNSSKPVTLPGSKGLRSLSWDQNSNLLYSTDGVSLFLVDSSTGQSSKICAQSRLGDIISLAFRKSDNQFLVAAKTDSNVQAMEFDPRGCSAGTLGLTIKGLQNSALIQQVAIDESPSSKTTTSSIPDRSCISADNSRSLSTNQTTTNTTQNIIGLGGYEYMTLDNAPIAPNNSTSTSGCQQQLLPIPDGWSVAPNNHQTRSFLASNGCWKWGTTCIVLADGSAINVGPQQGSVSLQDCGHDQLVQHGSLYGTITCPKRILLSRKIQMANNNETLQSSNFDSPINNQFPGWSSIGNGYKPITPGRSGGIGDYALNVQGKSSQGTSGTAQTVEFNSVTGNWINDKNIEGITVTVWTKVISLESAGKNSGYHGPYVDIEYSDGVFETGNVIPTNIEGESGAVVHDWVQETLQVRFIHLQAKKSVRVVRVGVFLIVANYTSAQVEFDDLQVNWGVNNDLVNFDLWSPSNGTVPGWAPFHQGFSVAHDSNDHSNFVAFRIEDNQAIYGIRQMIEFVTPLINHNSLYLGTSFKASSPEDFKAESGIAIVYGEVQYQDGSTTLSPYLNLFPSQKSQWQYADLAVPLQNKPISSIEFLITVHGFPLGTEFSINYPIALVMPSLNTGQSCSSGSSTQNLPASTTEYAEGLVYGDPHILNFQGDGFDVDDSGEYILSKDSKVEIQARFLPAGYSHLCVAVAMATADGVNVSIESLPNKNEPIVFVNSVPLILNLNEPSFPTPRITLLRSLVAGIVTYTVTFTNTGHSVDVSVIPVDIGTQTYPQFVVHVQVPTKYSAKATGLLTLSASKADQQLQSLNLGQKSLLFQLVADGRSSSPLPKENSLNFNSSVTQMNDTKTSSSPSKAVLQDSTTSVKIETTATNTVADTSKAAQKLASSASDHAKNQDTTTSIASQKSASSTKKDSTEKTDETTAKNVVETTKSKTADTSKTSAQKSPTSTKDQTSTTKIATTSNSPLKSASSAKEDSNERKLESTETIMKATKKAVETTDTKKVDDTSITQKSASATKDQSKDQDTKTTSNAPQKSASPTKKDSTEKDVDTTTKKAVETTDTKKEADDTKAPQESASSKSQDDKATSEYSTDTSKTPQKSSTKDTSDSKADFSNQDSSKSRSSRSVDGSENQDCLRAIQPILDDTTQDPSDVKSSKLRNLFYTNCVLDMKKLTQGRRPNDASDFANLNFHTRRDVASGSTRAQRVYTIVDSKANYARSGARRIATRSTVSRVSGKHLPNNYDYQLGQFSKSSSSSGSYVPVITFFAIVAVLFLVGAAALAGAAFYYARKNELSEEALQQKSSKTPIRKMTNILKNRLTTLDAEKLPDDVLTVVIESSDEEETSSDEEEEFSTSSREPSFRPKMPIVPKLSIPPRKGTPYKPSRFQYSDDEDEFDPADDILADDDDDDDDVSELPSTFSTDDYIDEAVANENDPLSVNPEPVSYFEPTQRLLNKIGRRYSIAQSALTSRLSNLTSRLGLKGESEASQPIKGAPATNTTFASSSNDDNVKSASSGSVSVAPLKLSLAQPSESNESSSPQMRTRNQSLFSRLSQALAPAPNADPVQLKDSESMEEIQLNSGHSREKKSKLNVESLDDVPKESDGEADDE